MSDTFKTIARFQYSTEARIIKGRLEAEGIRVFLSDHFMVEADPLISNAIGGVKLKVPAYQEQEALDILKDIDKYSMDDDGKRITCPECDSVRVELFSTISSFKSLFYFIIGVLSMTLPLYARYAYKCENCNTEFRTR